MIHGRKEEDDSRKKRRMEYEGGEKNLNFIPFLILFLIK